mmetsp:Transcript_22823/g.29573  ORF Transcript_22823/g.29573 Transcript_22823/m.29573 type:complete len:351 (+) Transcript_22823:13-1065(+)
MVLDENVFGNYDEMKDMREYLGVVWLEEESDDEACPLQEMHKNFTAVEPLSPLPHDVHWSEQQEAAKSESTKEDDDDIHYDRPNDDIFQRGRSPTKRRRSRSHLEDADSPPKKTRNSELVAEFTAVSNDTNKSQSLPTKQLDRYVQMPRLAPVILASQKPHRIPPYNNVHPFSSHAPPQPTHLYQPFCAPPYRQQPPILRGLQSWPNPFSGYRRKPLADDFFFVPPGSVTPLTASTLRRLGRLKVSRLRGLGIRRVEHLATVDVHDHELARQATTNSKGELAARTLTHWRDLARDYLRTKQAALQELNKSSLTKSLNTAPPLSRKSFVRKPQKNATKFTDHFKKKIITTL